MKAKSDKEELESHLRARNLELKDVKQNLKATTKQVKEAEKKRKLTELKYRLLTNVELLA